MTGLLPTSSITPSLSFLNDVSQRQCPVLRCIFTTHPTTPDRCFNEIRLKTVHVLAQTNSTVTLFACGGKVGHKQDRSPCVSLICLENYRMNHTFQSDKYFAFWPCAKQMWIKTPSQATFTKTSVYKVHTQQKIDFRTPHCCHLTYSALLKVVCQNKCDISAARRLVDVEIKLYLHSLVDSAGISSKTAEQQTFTSAFRRQEKF